MPLEPYDWNVVVLGRWNRGILTPQGIASRLFQLPPETEIGIEVPIDALGPFRVSHDELTVMVSDTRLIVEAGKNDFPSLEKAMRIARRAMENLEETPVFVAGFNIRTRGTGERGEEKGFCGLIGSRQINDRFQQAGYPLSRQEVTWVVDWPPGKISVTLVSEVHERGLRVNLNFERKGNHPDLVEWLARPINDIMEKARHLFVDVLALREEVVEWLPP